MDWGRFFFSAYGRIGRTDFWILFFVLLGVSCLIGWIPLVGLLPLYCAICARSKRLHDMGKTGWLQLVPIAGYAVAIVFTAYVVAGLIVSGVNGFESVAAGVAVVGGLTLILVWIMAFLLDFGFLLWIGLTEGQAFDNRFGPQRLREGAGSQTTYAPAA